MICPHCGVTVHIDFRLVPLERSPGPKDIHGWEAKVGVCPSCLSPVIYLVTGEARYDGYGQGFTGLNHHGKTAEQMIYPAAPNAKKAPAVVPKELAKDFHEASLVLSLSPQASAALSRRCLQHLLKEYGGTNSKNLASQIEEVIKGGMLSSHLNEQLDAVRNIGNFAAHPQKDVSTGEILPIEPHEAEWNLDVLEELFDHFFVKPEQKRKRTEELNKKLIAANKPPLQMKKTDTP